MVEHIGGDGTGEIRIDPSITMDVALDHMRTHVQSSLHISGIVNFPTTTYVEQNVINQGKIVGSGHWYIRGHSKFMSSGQSSCSAVTDHVGMYYFLTLTALSDGQFTLDDTSSIYNVDSSIAIFTDVLRMEGKSRGYIAKSANVMGQVLELTKQSKLDGNANGYGANSGTGRGCANGCGSGGGHGGSGGACSSSSNACGNCGGGSSYDSNVLPKLSGSGGGSCTQSTGGAGGGALRLVHTFSVIEGTVTMSAADCSGGGGGGAGGSIWIDGDVVAGWGSLYADGGNAGSDICSSNLYHTWYHSGGGGGGGRIRTWGKDYTSKVILHWRYVPGGSGAGGNGHGGTTYRYHGNACSGHGTMTASVCSCMEGYTGHDCQFTCHDDDTCGGNGVCNVQGQCQCNTGYVGTHCESQCDGTIDCNGHGECASCGICVCHPCYSGPDCSVKCSGSGSCVANQCKCDDCHVGVLCEAECNQHGTCNSTFQCSCHANWGGDKCTIKGCPGPDLNCNRHGICNSGTGQCFCDIGWKGEP